ncbi:PP2C family protein-serine/threonine phosphatase [Arenicella xantha]|uniref:Serine/threonine protein phosphatase PrpC n=1 Tax=Arenicella xantha TaxID=644221 RepID=A0A395JIH3_9GAMM|nr:PP2C family serine/threonine-protein phosphatase [Arenicella xantha]RBP48555.1 serine/threonine protein phosphatase PrpC [Arenicella xantha]
MPWITLAGCNIGDREEQQDRYLIEHSNDDQSHLLVVADGAGGHKTGGLAAQAAIDCVRENLANLWSNDAPEMFLNRLISDCNKRVLAVGGGELACTTLVLALIRGDEVFWAHVGDSRFYLIRDRHVIVRTNDHSVIELQRRQAAQNSRVSTTQSNELYMCLGALAKTAPDVSSSLVRDGDTLLLCSDGLWGQIDMKPIVADLSERPLTLDRLNNWITKAKVAKHNNSDNITLLAARLKSKPGFFPNPSKAIINFFKNDKSIN